MEDFTPVHPAARRDRPGLVRGYFLVRRDTFALVNDKSYTMKMGRIGLPTGPVYIVNDPPMVRRILVEQAAKFPKSRFMQGALKALLGDGVFISNGETWQRQRRMIDPAFDARGLEELFPLMLGAVDAMIGRLASATGRDVEIDVETTHLTADIVFRTIFSLPMEAAEARAVFEAFSRFQAATQRFAMLQMLPLPRILLPGYGAARRAAAQIRNLLGRFVRPRFEAARRCEADPRNDILAALLRARDPETGYVFGFEDLLDQICVLFLAGHETSASALAWALYLIANCPHLQERLHAEAVAVMGGGPARFAHIRQLKFARDVFRETLRLYPPVSFMLRDAGEATTMRDKAICPADPLFVSPWLIHRHRGQWERPDVFDPDRFASDSAKASLKTSYLPFSLGPRVCLGANFAMQEAILTLASMALTFRFDPVAGHVPRPVSRLTVRSANGIRLAVTLRPVSPGVAGAGENFPAAAP